MAEKCYSGCPIRMNIVNSLDQTSEAGPTKRLTELLITSTALVDDCTGPIGFFNKRCASHLTRQLGIKAHEITDW